MSQVVVSAGQSLVDVAIQEYGTTAALFELADANGLAITDPLPPGLVLEVPESAAAVVEVAGYFRARLQRINVGDSPLPPRLIGRRYFSTLFFSLDFYG